MPAPLPAPMWHDLARWFRAHSGHPVTFGPPAAPDELNALAAHVGFALPDDVVATLSIHDGAGRCLPEGMWLLSAAQIRQEWSANAEVADEQAAEWEEQEDELGPWDAPQDDGFVRGCVRHRRRLPIATNEAGAELFVDLHPGPRGQVGQVIMLINECDFVVVGSTLTAFVERWVQALEGGRLAYAEAYSQPIAIDGKAVWHLLVEGRPR